MSFTPMDLDSSLDDIIKKKKHGHHNNNKPSNSNKFKKTSSVKAGPQQTKQKHQASRPAIKTNKAKVTKPAPRSNINARLSTGSGPLFTAQFRQKQQQQQQQQQPIRADPSQIIITKAIAPTVTNNRNDNAPVMNTRPGLSSGLASRLGNGGGRSSSGGVSSRIQQPSSKIASASALSQQVRRYPETTIMSTIQRQTSQPQIRSMISRPVSSSATSSAYQQSHMNVSHSSSRYPSETYSSSASSSRGFGGGGGGRAEERRGEYSISGRSRMNAAPVPHSSVSTVSRSVPGIVGASSGLSIRGRSSINQERERTDISIKGESGPTTVLVTGLDPEANSEDVYITMEPFGHILRCEVMRDRSGRSYGEAEVEFSKKHFALDAIAMLDNKMCDGQILRVILRERPKSKSVEHFVQKQIRSIISSPSGKMYSDRL